MSLAEYLILFFAVLIGGSAALYFQEIKARYLSLLLSFSGAYVLGIAMLHLMPLAFRDIHANPGLWILAGFFVQLLLEQLSGGVEHGHIHVDENRGGAYAFQLMVGLCLHAFFEGLPLGNYEAFQDIHHGHVHSNDQLLFGIILHKAPAAFALTALLLASGYRKVLVIVCLMLFAMMSPLGAGLAAWLGQSGWLDHGVQEQIIAFVIGSFLHIATTILFETEGSTHHHLPWRKIAAIGLGLALAILGS